MALAITGSKARELHSHVTTYVKPNRWWTEVQGMDECRHGCKLFVRRQGAVLRYALIHSRSYGCELGATPVPVSVRIKV